MTVISYPWCAQVFIVALAVYLFWSTRDDRSAEQRKKDAR